MFEFLDIESSGLADESYPIEVGFTLGEQNFSYLIQPPAEWDYWDEDAELIYHHISREELATNGLKPYKVVQLLNKHLAGKTVYTDAYVFDAYWLSVLYSYVNVEMSFKLVDFKKLTADFGISDYSFFELKEELNDSTLAHRAAYDARLNKKVMQQLINK